MKILQSVGAIALTLTFSAAHAQPVQEWNGQRLPFYMALFPDPDEGNCFNLLQLESLPKHPQTGDILFNPENGNQLVLFARLKAVEGWLRGFFTAMNAFAPGVAPPRDLTKDIKDRNWMTWIYSYCRSHQRDNIVDAALELAKSLSPKTP